ncbi:hypothetical protein phiCbK_236 [Caulobacter phage phiCbK]|uniref:Uncharacterized protein n=4 Tax=Viruses TaxID=10239 RepID=J3SL03_9CAUD|nr:hypothetical protein D865_gp336 [Caulobacter phage phiCbK]AFO71752.1 hypothetical protein phiCbK_236 [Caulobacter phage phiCbK]AFU86914.1 hypothetical protein CbK_gp082 [Caulobacter phage phiCbK]ARB15589.1 hypothetical protein Ccr34_gp088 [Caulobacter phage Ccr34]
MSYKILRAATFDKAEFVNPNGESLVNVIPEPFSETGTPPGPADYRWGVIAPGEKIGDTLLLTFSKIAFPMADQEPIQVPPIKLIAQAPAIYHAPLFYYPTAPDPNINSYGRILEIRLSAILPFDQETGAEDITPLSAFLRWMGRHWLIEHASPGIIMGAFQAQTF